MSVVTPHISHPLNVRTRKNSKEKRPDWQAPQNIAIYLSKIELPDLDPNRLRASASNGQSRPLSSAPKPSISPKPSAPAPIQAKPTTKSDEPAKPSKKPTKVFSNPFSSLSSTSSPAATPAQAKPLQGNASPPAMPGAWSGPAKPLPPPSVPANRPPPPAVPGGSNGNEGNGNKVSALQKLINISRK